ncbi:MAG: hypothetical protein KHY46_11185 [Clostridiales bacterium]|nr:hypothetical protein [Clostridiales bacterium]
MREKTIVLSHEDFEDFPIGEFPYDRDHTATGEYHYIREKGYAGNWYDPVCNYTYNGTGPTWIITEYEGVHYMESMRIEKNRPHRMFPTLETGKRIWADYKVSARLVRMSKKGMAGLAFCLNNSLDTLVFCLEGEGTAKLVYRHKEEVTTIKETEFPHDCDHSYVLSADCFGDFAECRIDGKVVLKAGDTADEEWVKSLIKRGGKVGITADCPAKFTDVLVTVSEEGKEELLKREKRDRKKQREEEALHPEMVLWKKIDLKNFGTSRQVRFGHLTGSDEWFIVLAQMQKRVSRDAYGFISCLTAIDLDGNILWQTGETSERSEILGKVSADMPFQVYDIDGDGKDEVIVGRNFEIQILDGATGVVRKAVKTPRSIENDEELIGVPYGIYAFDRINPDGIRICNLRGTERAADILIKDRYCRIYALDEDLNLLWNYQSPKNTGHCPLPLDVNGDGKDEILAGYTLLDCQGKELWTYPIEGDHTDEIVAGKFRGDGKGYFACVSGTEGFFIGDFHGNILARDFLGHAQRISVANYCPERPGFEIAVTNFWGHQGVIYLYDSDGKQLWEMENECNGNILSPVNWDGTGQELILTNADPKKGGMLSGNGIRAVSFPDDGHPTLCCEAVNLMGDEREEIVVWDYKWMYIYTQKDNHRPQNYHPVKFHLYNASNYRGEYAYPNEWYLDFRDERRSK